ncbi:MAG: hypothetical protein IIY40_05835, partial [Firmicutes bacterium]|nr:hypothetical protein [Bacillota bacterium]
QLFFDVGQFQQRGMADELIGGGVYLGHGFISFFIFDLLIIGLSLSLAAASTSEAGGGVGLHGYSPILPRRSRAVNPR